MHEYIYIYIYTYMYAYACTWEGCAVPRVLSRARPFAQGCVRCQMGVGRGYLGGKRGCTGAYQDVQGVCGIHRVCRFS